MEKIDRKLKELLWGTLYSDLLNSNTKLIYHRIQMDRDDFLDDFNIRYESNIRNGIEIDGFRDVLKNIKESIFEVVICHSLENDSFDIAVYTNVETSILFGIINFKQIHRR